MTGGSTAKQKNMTISHCYDFPVGMGLIKKISCLRYIPVCPTYAGFDKRKYEEDESVELGPDLMPNNNAIPSPETLHTVI